MTAAYLIALIIAFLLLAIGLILFVVLYHRRVVQHQTQMQKFHQEKHLELLQASIKSEEGERKRIAQELHDNVGATLATIRLYLKQAASAAANPDLLTVPAQLLDESISKVRMLSQQLQPDMLLYLGLVKSLRSLAKRISGAGPVQVELFQNTDWAEPASDIILPVYRVIQEIITNLIRHGNATHLELHLKTIAGLPCISLEHNGIPFTSADYTRNLAREDSVGLKNIASRMEAANLSLQFPPAAGGRNFIVVCLPEPVPPPLKNVCPMPPTIKYIIADDHAIFRKGLHFVLSEDPQLELLAEADNGREVIRLLETLKPHVVVLDLKMPEMDGVETTAQIRIHYPDVKILILTMSDEEELILHLLEAGANGYLMKDADAAEIRQAIHSCHKEGRYFNNYTSNLLLRKLIEKDQPKDLPAGLPAFSDRELEVLRYLCEGCTAAEIGKKIFLSPRTVEGIKAELLEKTDSRNTASLVLYAVKNGLDG